jgi:glucokinase
MAGYAIGVDLGGTNIKGGIVDVNGKVIASESVKTNVEKGCEEVVKRIVQACEQVIRKSKLDWSAIRGVGIGSPGTLNLRKGIVLFSPNLPCMNGAPLLDLVRARLKRVRCILENDANAAAYGEKWAGVGRKVNNLVLFTLGTGIGGGVIIDGKVLHGFNDVAAELGHQVVYADGRLCGCGNHGCIEAYASAPATVRRMKEAIAAGKKSILKGDFEAADISRAALQGDQTAREIMEETGRLLGVVATNMLHIFNPEMVVFDGGMTAAGDLLLTPIRDEVKKRAFKASQEGVQIVFGELGANAGMIGAAGCVLQA